jgi:hypothetical protein
MDLVPAVGLVSNNYTLSAKQLHYYVASAKNKSCNPPPRAGQAWYGMTCNFGPRIIIGPLVNGEWVVAGNGRGGGGGRTEGRELNCLCLVRKSCGRNGGWGAGQEEVN